MRNPLLKPPAPRILRKQVLDSAPWLAAPPNPDLDEKPATLRGLGEIPTGWWSILAAAAGSA